MLVDPSVIQPDMSQVITDSSDAVLSSTKPLLDTLLSGDSLIIGAAFLYALQILRISKWTKIYSPLQIMTGKTVAELFLSLVFVGSTALLANSGMDVSDTNGALQYLHNCGQQTMDFSQSVSRGLVEHTIPLESIEHFAGACLWTGLVTTCYLVFAQSYGQQQVKASDANLIYSLQPLFTAIFAYYMLGETLEPMGFVGGSFIFAGVYLVASKSLVTK
jgi:drug/metabolite transporter (DMT)-like permease